MFTLEDWLHDIFTRLVLQGWYESYIYAKSQSVDNAGDEFCTYVGLAKQTVASE